MVSDAGDPRPVGVFDSGVGGLSIAREIRVLLPSEDILYLADTANCPYGPRPPDEIRRLALEAAGALVKREAKAIVVACNTASVAALSVLRQTHGVPFVGIVPAIKPAASATRRRRIGVLATEATLHGELFDQLVAQFARDVVLVRQAAPDLVELVERGETSGERAERLLKANLEPLLAEGIDSLVLGCTHYPFLRPAIQRLVGPAVQVFDTGEPVARQLARVLAERKLRRAPGSRGLVTLITSGDPAAVGPLAERLLGEPFGAVERRVPRSSDSKDRSSKDRSAA